MVDEREGVSERRPRVPEALLRTTMNIAENDRTWKMITVSISTIIAGNTTEKSPVCFSRLFYIAACFDPVALGQFCDNRLNRLFNLPQRPAGAEAIRRCHPLPRNCRHTITAFEDRFFRTNFEVADLAQWNSLSPSVHQSHVVQLSGIEAVSSATSSDYLHRSNVFADLSDRRTRQKKLDLFRSVVEERPISCSRAWSKTKCTVGARSPQSKFTCRVWGFVTIAAWTCAAIAWSTSRSGPVTRKATGHGEYGPNTSCEARTRASGASPCSTRSRSLSFKRSRSFSLAVRTMIFAKLGFGSSGLYEKKKRGAPAPM